MEPTDRIDADTTAASGISRRRVLKTVGAATAVAWAAPVVTSLGTRAYAASSSNPHPECVGSSCGNFIPCSSSNGDCVCVTGAQGGGFCIPGSTPCSSLQPCDQNNQCPSGNICAVDTCCGQPLCVPESLEQQCPPDPNARHNASPRSRAHGTIAQR